MVEIIILELQEQNSVLQNELLQKNLELIYKDQQLNSINECLKKIDKEIIHLKFESNCKKKVERINYIIRLIDENTQNDNYFNNFKDHLNKVHLDFYKKLNNEFKSITVHELNICALIRMKFNNTLIAQLFHIKINSVRQIRKKIKKKLGLEHHKSLDKFLLNI